MKKLFLMLTLVGGGFFLNACDKDDDNAKDPAASLIDYVGKPYSTFAADCEKAGYTKSEDELSSSNQFVYTKNGVMLQAVPSTGNIQIAGKVKETNATVSQIADNLAAADKSILDTYKEILDKGYNLDKGGNDTSYDTIEELCTAFRAQTLGYYQNADLTYITPYKGTDIGIMYNYAYDKQTQKGQFREVYMIAAQ